MKASEMLTRLDKAKEIISSLPPDTRILTVEVDGLGSITGRDISRIHLGDPIQDLIGGGVIAARALASKNDPEQKYIEDSVLIGGFRVFSLRDREEAAPSDTSTEDGRAAQAAI